MENEIREGIVPFMLNSFSQLAACWIQLEGESFISMTVYGPKPGINKIGVTNITINGATHSWGIALNPAEIEAIRKELINFGAINMEGATFGKKINDFQLQEVGAIRMTISDENLKKLAGANTNKNTR